MQTIPVIPNSTPLPEPFARHLDALLEMRQRLPEGASPDLRRRLTLAIQVASSPACPESQADGVPCSSLEGSCDHCSHALRWIEGVRDELEDALEAEGLHRRDPRDI